jgi:hypothetical protein
MGIKEVRRMVKKRFVIFKEQVRDFCRKGWESRVIGVKGNIILVEAEVPEEHGDKSAYRIEEMINEPGEC